MGRKNILDKLRMWQWLALAAAATGCLYLIAVEQLGILLLKTTYITIALVLGYYADRHLFPYSRPHTAKNDIMRSTGYGHNGERHEPSTRLAIIYAAAMLRRALVVAAVVIGFSIGL